MRCLNRPIGCLRWPTVARTEPPRGASGWPRVAGVLPRAAEPGPGRLYHSQRSPAPTQSPIFHFRGLLPRPQRQPSLRHFGQALTAAQLRRRPPHLATACNRRRVVLRPDSLNPFVVTLSQGKGPLAVSIAAAISGTSSERELVVAGTPQSVMCHDHEFTSIPIVGRT